MKTLDALDRFLVQLEADGRSVHTIGQYRRHVRLLARWAAQEDPSGDVLEIDHEALARFLTSPAARNRPDGRPKRTGSVNALRTSLRSFFGHLRRAGIIDDDPARLVRRARCGPPIPRGLGEEDRTRLLRVLSEAEDAPGRRDHALFHLLMATGLRLGSALGLNGEDVDLERGELHVRNGKNGRGQVVFLGDAVARHLGEYLAGRRGGPLFAAHKGRPMTARHAQRRLTLWLRRAGARASASPHSLRHGFALELYQRTGDVLVVKEALGHRSIASTMVYAQASGARVRAAVTGMAVVGS